MIALPSFLALLPAAWMAYWAYGYFYGEQAAGLFLTVACALLMWRISRGVVGRVFALVGPQRDLPYEAHWATPREVRGFVAKAHRGKAVMLGKHKAGLLGIYPGAGGQKELGHFLICGPSRAGKGLHLVYNLLQWKGSTVVLDIKGENYTLTAGARQKNSRILVLDPSGQGNQYDPFAELGHSPEGLRSAALLILEPDKDQDVIFAERAAPALYAGLLAAQLQGKPTLPYLRHLTDGGLLGYIEELSKLENPEINRALVDFLGCRPHELSKTVLHTDRFLTSSWSNMTTRLQPLFSRGMLKMMGGSDFQAADLFEKPHSLYLIFHESDLEYTKRAMQVILLALITAMIRNQDHASKAPAQTVLLGFDEAGREVIPRLPDLVSTVAGRGMSAMIYVQDISQLDGKYGQSGAKTIKNNCHTQMFYRPYDLDTARYISDMTDHTTIVEVEEMERQESKGLGVDRRRSETFRMRSLITPGEARQLPREKVIIFTQDRPPILAERLVYYEEGWALKASQIAPPEIEPLPEVALAAPPEAKKPKVQRKARTPKEAKKPTKPTKPTKLKRPKQSQPRNPTPPKDPSQEAQDVSKHILGDEEGGEPGGG